MNEITEPDPRPPRTVMDDLSGAEREKLSEALHVVAEAVVHVERVRDAVIDVLDLAAKETALALHVPKLGMAIDLAARLDEAARSEWTGIEKSKEFVTDGDTVRALIEQLTPKQ
jgi:hypothetical protein